jgi:hypothetical protein
MPLTEPDTSIVNAGLNHPVSSIGMMDVTAMAVVSRTRWWRRSRGGTDDGTQTSADRGTDPGAVPAASDSADYRSRSGTE